MRYDYSKLLGRIVEKCGTQARFADQMGLSEHTVSVRLNGKAPFRQTEIQKAIDILGIDDKDIHAYFFTQNVQKS